MERIGKYGIELRPEKKLSLYKPDLTSSAIGTFTVRAQRRGETETVLIPVSTLLISGEGIIFYTALEYLGVKISGRFDYSMELDGLECNVAIEASRRSPEFNLHFQWEVKDSGVPRWLVPGVFYKDNRPPGSHRLYPGFSPTITDLKNYISPYWSFAAERTATPCVFAWTEHYSLYLGTRARFENIETGVSLEGNEGKAVLGVCFPWREEPIRNCELPPAGNSPEIGWLQLEPGEVKNFWFQLAAEKRDLHYYNRILRYRYFKEKDQHPLNSWVSRAEAKNLLGYGLYHWHYDAQRKIIAETRIFNPYEARKQGYSDRNNMHIAWISGLPVAYALLWLGFDTQNSEFIEAAQGVISNIADNLTPFGTFWGQWSAEKGWTSSWALQENLLQARTLAEATLFLLRALRLELRRGCSHPNWVHAIQSNLKFSVKAQRDDGNFGSYYDMKTGEVVSWEGTTGVLWSGALIAAAMLFQLEEFVPPALAGADFYSRFIEDEFLFGAPEDIGFASSSEDGYCALQTYLLLYQYNRSERWLELAQRSADWLLSFRMSYNCQFPPQSILGIYDFRSRGADIASVVNQHLHCYGLICYPELLHLAYYLGDEYYRERAQDNLLCFRQFIAREDGDFGARKGMVSEQYYHTDWLQPKGNLLPLSHAWCIGHTILANLVEEHNGRLP